MADRYDLINLSKAVTTTANGSAVTSLAFGANNTNQMTFAANGNVGIGTSSPTASLSVTGTANVSGAFSVGGIITSPSQAVLRLDGNNSTGVNFASGTTLLTSTYYQTTGTGFSRGNISWNSSNGKVTVATAGVYQIMYQVYVQRTQNDNGRVELFRNGSLWQIMQTTGAIDGTYSLNTLINLQANDYLELVVSTFDPIYMFMGSFHTNFNISFLG